MERTYINEAQKAIGGTVKVQGFIENPVSYTHLRQRCTYPLGQHKGQHRTQGLHQPGRRPCGKGLSPGAPAVGQRPTDRRPIRDILQADAQAQCQRAAYSVRAVSYTHLDVYKRQPPRRHA